jgi:hypothetical protein
MNKFPKESFLISGVSYYQNVCNQISKTSILHMLSEPNNEYDKNAIAIFYNSNKIGYVPKTHQQLCFENINSKLKIAYFKQEPTSGNIGIRVIFEEYYGLLDFVETNST